MLQRTKYIALILVLLFSLNSNSSFAAFWNPKKQAAEQADTTASKSKADDRYSKIFQGKDKKDSKYITTVEGLFKLHTVDQKLIFELEDQIFDKPMVIHSFVDAISNPSLGYIGQRASAGMAIMFTKTDSLVHVRRIYATSQTEDSNIQRALDNAQVYPIISSSPILALSPDSTKTVFDATSFLMDNNLSIVNMNQASFFGGVRAIYNKANSFITGIEAYDQSVAIVSERSFGCRANFMGFESTVEDPLTAVIRIVISTLPEQLMPARLADERVGTDYLMLDSFDGNDQGSKETYYVSKWNLKPVDKQAHQQGEMVEVEKPIVFYVDTLFNDTWSKAICEGLEKWNAAFERIGYKNVIQAMPYPKDDTLFSANNPKFNCVKYAQNSSRATGVAVFKDPRSGEILNASAYIGRDVAVSYQREALLKTGAYNPNVRRPELQDEEFSQAAIADMMSAMGRCLGFRVNYAAGCAYTLDQIRDKEFTDKNGFLSSVMSDITYNFVAQPEDYLAGVKVIKDELGVYDYFLVDWSYSDQSTDLEQQKIDNKQTLEAIKGKAEYKYSPVQYFTYLMDPRYTPSNLGDDPMMAAELSYNNLKYVVANSYQWIDDPSVDESYRQLFVDFIFLDMASHITPILGLVGGWYTELGIDNNGPTYKAVPMDLQKKAVKYMLDLTQDLSWLDEKQMLRAGGPNDNLSKFTEYNVSNMFIGSRLFSPALKVAPGADPSANSYRELMDFTVDHITGQIQSGKTISYGTYVQAEIIMAYLKKLVVLKPTQTKEGRTITASISDNEQYSALDLLKLKDNNPIEEFMVSMSYDDMTAEDISAYEPARGFKFVSPPAINGYHYSLLNKLQKSYELGASRSKDERQKSSYQYNSYLLTKFLNAK